MAPGISYYILKAEGRHRVEVYLLMMLYAAIVVSVAVHGFSYYRLPLEQRPFHPLYQELRPSGAIGIRLAFLGVASFCGIYLYAIRKRWKWLGRVGKTRNWLDVHVVLGIGAPVLITFHSAFKMRGLAGVAYWIMIAVMLSGIVGRYLYAQIPRRINAAELSLQEMQAMTEELTGQLQKQSLVAADELQPLLAVPPKEEVEALPVALALLLMFWCDLQRPFLVARIRRRAVSGLGKVRTAWGLLPSREPGLEKIIDLARRRSWIATKISFLAKTHQVFHLWHVVHRPFSYSFAILVCVHATVAMLMGYF
ncbi:MAG TPA: hypothetical protein VJ732_14115 [Bryobacteraceae bacterium]|nr:hypothetical protein [Bryobacteraceae bacterium]